MTRTRYGSELRIQTNVSGCMTKYAATIVPNGWLTSRWIFARPADISPKSEVRRSAHDNVGNGWDRKD